MSFPRKKADQEQKKQDRPLNHICNNKERRSQSGKSAEDLVEKSIRQFQRAGNLPFWFKGWEHYEVCSEMNRNGIHFCFYVDNGRAIFVNIERSIPEAKKFKFKHPESDVHVFIVDIRKNVAVIYDELIDELISWRELKG